MGEGGPPCPDNHASARQGKEGVECPARRTVTPHQVLRGEPEADTVEKTEEVRPQVGVLSLGAEEGEEGKGRGHGEEPAPSQLHALAHEAHGPQDADGAEDGGGGSHRGVLQRLHPGVHEIAEASCGKEETPG